MNENNGLGLARVLLALCDFGDSVAKITPHLCDFYHGTLFALGGPLDENP
mgnify:CR=1 FL=1